MSGFGQEETVVTAGRPAVDSPPGTTPPPPASEAPSVVRIGRYEIIKLLGRGGMGAVSQALDPVLDRAVALKVMLPEAAGDQEHKQRFEREAKAVARLQHPGVVTVFDLGYHTDGSPYIVMELLKGRDLLARLRLGPPLSLEEKVSIVTQVLDGLGHAHKAGIVHRDIKPANVFLTDEGSARIMDFGIAFWTSSGGTSRTVLGTVGYMSPEQVRGSRWTAGVICSASAASSASFSRAVARSTARRRWRRSTGSRAARPRSSCHPDRSTRACFPSCGARSRRPGRAVPERRGVRDRASRLGEGWRGAGGDGEGHRARAGGAGSAG
jgi:serine/threonine protein kinase